MEWIRELGDCFLVDEELRWTAIDLFADNELEESRIEDSVGNLLACVTLSYKD